MFICEISKEPQKYKNPSTKHLYTPFLFTLIALSLFFVHFNQSKNFVFLSVFYDEGHIVLFLLFNSV